MNKVTHTIKLVAKRLGAPLNYRKRNNSFDWIIGANTMDDDTLRAIDELNEIDKQKRLNEECILSLSDWDAK